jgi:hypothetical protein
MSCHLRGAAQLRAGPEYGSAGEGRVLPRPLQ